MENTDAPGVQGEPGEHRASGHGRDLQDAHFCFADDSASPADSQELTRGLAWERAVSPSLANRLSLSVDESHEGLAPAGPNILQYNDAGWDEEDSEDGV